jgi:acyl-CoA hydrolase
MVPLLRVRVRLCLPSRTTLRDGRVVSNVVHPHPAGTRVTIPEHCADWVVTEYGAVRLKLLSLGWRAAALIGIAHPSVRDDLARQARDAGLEIARPGMHRQPPAEFFRPAVDPGG